MFKPFFILKCFALTPLLVAPAIAWAEVASNDVDLVCDVAENLALVRFSTDREAGPTFPHLPQSLEHALLASGPPGRAECTLANGTTVRVRGGRDQALGYGEGGGNPPLFFSLWVNQRKVISREVWKPGYRESFDDPAVHDGALIAANRITVCATAESKPQQCATRQLDLAKSPIDRVEYPKNAKKAPVGHIAVVAKGAANRRFCESYLGMIKGGVRSALRDEQTPLDIDLETLTTQTSLDKPEPRSGLVNLSPGVPKRLLMWEGGNGYFDGTVIAMAPPGMAVQHVLAAYPFDDIDEWPKRAGLRGVTLISGGHKQLYPDVSSRYVHLRPQAIKGALYVFAYPTNSKVRPTAALVKPLAAGGFVTLCAFNRNEPNF